MSDAEGLLQKSFFRRHPLLMTVSSVALVSVGAIILLGTYFISSLRNIIESQGSDRLGRKFVIEGPIHVDWDWSVPHVQAEQVKLENMPESEDTYMLEIDKLDFKIKIWQLLYGRTEIPEFYIENAKLILEKKDEKHKNWEFPALSSGRAATDIVLPDDRHDFPIIENLKIVKSNLIYRDAEKGLNVDLKLDTARSEGGGEEYLIVNGDGTLQNKAFDIKAEGGSLEFLRHENTEFPLKFSLTMGDTKIEADGLFKDPIKLTGIDTSLNLSGHNMADLFYLTGIPLPPTPPYKLSGQLSKSEAVWAYKGFKGKVGDSDLAGDLTYDTGGERGFMKAALVSQRMDMDDLGGFIGMAPSTDKGETAAPEQKAQKQKERQSAKLLPDVPINLKRLRSADMDVSMKVAKLSAPHLPFNGMDVHLKLNDGLLRIDPMFLSLADGIMKGNMTLDGRTDMPVVETDMNFQKLKLSRFFAGSRFEEATKGTFGGTIQLKGNGTSLANVMADSDGRIVVMMSGGTISLLLIEASGLDIAEGTPLLLGEDKTTQIRCGVGDFKVTDGILYSQVFVLDTTDTNVQGRVDINLKNETIKGELDAEPKDTSPLALQSPITITGPLKNPSIGLEVGETGARAVGAVLLGVALTPLAAIIPYIEPGLGEDSDCKALIAHAKQAANNN